MVILTFLLGAAFLCFAESNVKVSDVRLLTHGESSESMGHVQILVDGVWWKVCSDGYDLNEAKATCRSFGRPLSNIMSARNRFMDDYLLYRVDCSDAVNNSLIYCKVQGPMTMDECQSGLTAAVSCQEPKITSMRFANSILSNWEPFSIEVGDMHGWICFRLEEDAMDSDDPDELGPAVCRQFGYGSGNLIFVPLDQEDGASAENFVYEVDCNGNEESIRDCKFEYQKPGSGHCNWRYNAIECRYMGKITKVRHTNGNNSGPLEIFVGSTWGYICIDSQVYNIGHVACQDLGSQPLKENAGVPIHESEKLKAFFHVRCLGNEHSLTKCEVLDVNSSDYDCKSGQKFAVTCQYYG